ncbi:Protein of unknown function [Tropicimonas sediminicola]|uniref:DUF2955 domain-containing protein n=1 Tax=Tropicimonas sediminicola TaxID=1031541 RepID=A0A239GZG5_9RHOB|nr:Protein of unknown function [Tropicimonas sediminicola]
MRLALGPAVLFILGVAFDWPMAFVGAVFAALFLQAPAPPSLAGGTKLVLTALGLLMLAAAVFSLLQPYPVHYLIGVCLAVLWAFGLSVRGRSPLLVVLALLAALLVPLLARGSVELAVGVVFWLSANMVFALLTTWAAFVLLPVPEQAHVQQEAPQGGEPEFDPERRLVRMALVTVPFALAFFLVDGGAPLTLLFVAILAQQLAASTEDGPAVAGAMLAANLIGGLAAVTAHELVVAATFFPFLALVVLAVCLGFGWWHASERPDSALAGSAMTTFLILFGGAIAPLSDSAEVAMLSRLGQIGLALAWVLTAFVVLDALLPERAPRLPDWRKTQPRGHAHGAKAPGPHA